MRFRQSNVAAALLNLLLPGLGHAYWREYLFGLFVFLIMLIAVALFLVSFLVHLPRAAELILFGLPVVFYLFTFVDLFKTVQRRRVGFTPGGSRCLIFFAVGLAFQLAVPAAPFHFMLKNRPKVFRIADNNLSPLYRRGDIVKASSLTYAVDLFFFERPVFHSFPERFDVIRFVEGASDPRIGVVIGLPGERVEVLEGVVAVNGVPYPEPRGSSLILTGDWPLTSVGPSSILVATMYLSSVRSVVEVPLPNVQGKVDPIL